MLETDDSVKQVQFDKFEVTVKNKFHQIKTNIDEWSENFTKIGAVVQELMYKSNETHLINLKT